MNRDKSPNADKILVIIPCFNEETTISSVLDRIHVLGDERLHPLVIDDGSTDATFERARSKAMALRLPMNLGIGAAVQAGIKYALLEGYGHCVQVDGDGQHSPEEIVKLFDIMQSSGSNMVVGSRFLDLQSHRSTPMRRLGSSLLSLAFRLLYKRHISDPTSGFRLMDRNAIDLFNAYYPSDFPEPISIAYALNKQIKVTEAPVVMHARHGGKSSIAGFKTVNYMIRTLVYIFLIRLIRF